MMKKLLASMAALFLLSFSNAQNFIRLLDASGVIPTTEEVSSAEFAAQQAINILPAADRPLFKVYDVGFYVHTPVTVGGIPPVWTEVKANIENDPASDFYLIFGRESSSEGLNTRVRVKLKLPTSSSYSCLTEEEKGNLERYIEQAVNANLGLRYIQAEVVGLEFLKDYLYKIVVCNCSNVGANCNQFSNFTFLDLQLRGLGFRKKEVQLGGASSWGSGAQGIYDYAGKKVIIDGDEYDIADQISEGKAILEASSQVLPDSTINTSVAGEVYILDNESFTNGEWEAAKARSAAVDYVEYWVILTSNSGQTHLYSRFTIGDFGPVAAKGGGGAEKRGVFTASPWGLALKALGNAAVDAVVQAVIIRIVDPNAQDWGYAWSKVSYLGAAWEGLSSLIPWKKDLLSGVVRAATSAFAVVLDNALRMPDYTTKQGLIDFGIGFAASGITQLVSHPKTIKWVGPPATKWAKIAFARGIKGLYKVSPPALKRVTLAVQKNIIGDGGNIAKMYDKYESREYAEVFYRKIEPSHYDILKNTFKMVKGASNETTTSPNISFVQNYDGVLVKFYVEPGTIEKLKAVGTTAHKNPDHSLVLGTFGSLPHGSSGWHPTKVRFKVEENKNVNPFFDQINIQLGSGYGLDIFNDNLLFFEKL